MGGPMLGAVWIGLTASKAWSARDPQLAADLPVFH